MIFWSVGSQLSYLVHPVNQKIPKNPGLGVILSSLGIILHCKWVLKWQFWISRQKNKMKDQIWRRIWVLLALLIIFIPITCIYHETLAHFNIICWIRALWFIHAMHDLFSSNRHDIHPDMAPKTPRHRHLFTISGFIHLFSRITNAGFTLMCPCYAQDFVLISRKS